MISVFCNIWHTEISCIAYIARMNILCHTFHMGNDYGVWCRDVEIEIFPNTRV